MRACGGTVADEKAEEERPGRGAPLLLSNGARGGSFGSLCQQVQRLHEK